jgi:hypothetical protein
MKYFRIALQFVFFLAVFMSAYVLYQIPNAPTKFIYYNF